MKKWLPALILTPLLVACTKKYIIPEKDMVHIVAQIFITDAITVSIQTAPSFFNRDSIEYYAPIYGPLGYTTREFDSSVVFYSRHPEAFNHIIDKAINELLRRETELKNKIVAMDSDSLDASNLWVGKRKWILPVDGAEQTIDFKIPISATGKYTLSALVRLLPSDESLNPKLKLGFTLHNDSTVINEVSQALHKDGTDRLIKISSTISNPEVSYIVGSLLHHEKKGGKWVKRAEVSAIKIELEPEKIEEPQKAIKLNGTKPSYKQEQQ